MAEWKERPQYTPVPVSARDAAADLPGVAEGERSDEQAGQGEGPAATAAVAGEASAARTDEAGRGPAGFQPVRAINEDDDGYDPYSDWHDQGVPAPLFERNPWE